MKAPEIKHYINWLGRVEYRNINCSFTYDETSYAAIDRIFRLLHRLEPGPENTSWELWLRAERGTIEDFGSFEELRADGQVESFEEFETWWHSEFPEEAAWFHFAAGEDQKIGYRAIFLGHRHVLEVDSRKERAFPYPRLWHSLSRVLTSGKIKEDDRRKERMPILQPLESMERISRQALADDLDTVLERISREDIGLVITEEGKDDLVLCPASWFNLDYVDDFSCVINSALRYAMRSEDEESAAVVQYLRRHYQLFDEKTLSVAVADLERELNQPIVTLKQPQVWKELQELFRQRLDELRKESSEGEETHHG